MGDEESLKKALVMDPNGDRYEFEDWVEKLAEFEKKERERAAESKGERN